MYIQTKQSGVVSLFAVLFTTLLLTVLTVGFMRIMVQEQKQAQNQDLSQSAYDSAMSGVEDAKRAIKACRNGDAGACLALNAKKCSTIQDAGIVGSVGATETTIKSNTGTETDLNQAYTCVVVDMQTTDYLGNLEEGQSITIPLHMTGAFSEVSVEWMHKDGTSGGATYSGGGVDTLSGPMTSGDLQSLPAKNAWSASAPSLMRVLAVLPSAADSVSYSDLEAASSTVFLRPANNVDNAATSNTVVGVGGPRAELDGGAATMPSVVACSKEAFDNGGYACHATLRLMSGEVPAGSNVAFLRLTSLYKATSYRVTVGDASIYFDGVQPKVDSTGRASDVFRRVSARLNTGATLDDALLPSTAVSTSGSLCKDFYLSGMSASGSTCNTK